MKYRQALPILKKKVKEMTGAQKISFSLERWQSGGGGEHLYITTWSHHPIYPLLAPSIRFQLYDLMVDIEDLHGNRGWWNDTGISFYFRKYQEPLAEAPQWRHDERVEAPVQEG